MIEKISSAKIDHVEAQDETAEKERATERAEEKVTAAAISKDGNVKWWSQPGLPQEALTDIGIIVIGANEIQNGDEKWWLPWDHSDAYMVARVGPKGSKWEDKLRGSGRKSDTHLNSAHPVWNVGWLPVVNNPDDELTIRVIDHDILSDGNNELGEVTVALHEIYGDGQGKQSDLKLSKAGTVRVVAGPASILASRKVKPSQNYEDRAKTAPKKSVRVEDADKEMLIGKAPLPKNIQGLFWLTEQLDSSALASFGGPTDDGGGCNPGTMATKAYEVCVTGSRTWAWASQKVLEKVLAMADTFYTFTFNDAKDPKKCQITIRLGKASWFSIPEWVMDFEMHLIEAGEPEYPGSVIWLRNSSLFAGGIANTYKLIQVVDGAGKKLPAFQKFVDFQKSAAAGDSPGKLWLRAYN